MSNLAPPDEITRKAIGFVELQDRETWAAQDQQALDQWLAQSTSHKIAYLRVRDAWQKADRLVALRRPMKAPSRRAALGNWVKVAAALAIFATISVLYAPQFFAEKGQLYTTLVGAQQIITLRDGSTIEMNTDTAIRVGADHRTAWLEKGEAYFRIVHNDKHPFIVNTGHHRVTDLGTEFLVQNVGSRIEVALVEGRAAFDALDGRMRNRVIDMQPGNLIVAENDLVVVTQHSVPELQTKLAWQKGMLIFDRTTLEEAAAQFNRYNQKKLVITDPVVAKRKIGGTFPVMNTELFAHTARNLMGLHVEYQDNRILISR